MISKKNARKLGFSIYDLRKRRNEHRTAERALRNNGGPINASVAHWHLKHSRNG